MSRTPPREVELKLLCSPECGEELFRDFVLLRRLTEPVQQRELVSTYFDTADRRLAARSLSLRIRCQEGRFIQTLKGPPEPGALLADRIEWEIDLAAAAPDLGAFGDPQVEKLAGPIEPAELGPLFTVHVQRRSMAIRWPEPGPLTSTIEVSLDLGRIVAGEQSQPVSEIELELVEGDPRAAFAVADRLRRGRRAMRIGSVSKGERGLLLATGGVPPVTRAERLRLADDASVEDVLAAVLRHCVIHALRNEAAAVDGRDIEGVHQLRVALRRLRSALSLFRDAVPPASRERWSTEARWLLRHLGPCRDFDVLRHELLAPVMEALPSDASLAAFADLAERARRAAHQEVGRAVAARRSGDFLLALACWVEGRGWSVGASPEMRAVQAMPAQDFARDTLDRMWRRVRKRGRHFARLGPPERHALRIACKKLRYGCEFLAEPFGRKRSRAFGRALAAVQDGLGHMNDIVVARLHADRLLGQLRGGPAPRASAARGAGTMIGWHGHAALALEARSRRLWDELTASEPYWRHWG